ncbi:unnamed protein product [Caenorhabditis brenneri]
MLERDMRALIVVVIIVDAILFLLITMCCLLCIIYHVKKDRAEEVRSGAPDSTKNPEASVSLMSNAV